jgi:hypothetical protein
MDGMPDSTMTADQRAVQVRRAPTRDNAGRAAAGACACARCAMTRPSIGVLRAVPAAGGAGACGHCSGATNTSARAGHCIDRFRALPTRPGRGCGSRRRDASVHPRSRPAVMPAHDAAP